MTGLSRCGKQYRTFDAADQYKLASDGRYWPAGFLDGDNGLPGIGWSYGEL